MDRIFVSLAVVLALVLGCTAQQSQFCQNPSTTTQCPNEQRNGCCTWTPENATDQTYFKDHTLNFTSDTSCRPLGFVSGTYYYQKPAGVAQPCAKLACKLDTNGQCSEWVSLLVQSNSQLCAEFRVNGVRNGNEVCEDGGLSICRKIPGTSGMDVDVNFYSNNGGESDTLFWYRMITFTPQAGQDGNDLCPLQPSQIPNELIQLPSGQDPRNQNPTIEPATTGNAPHNVLSASLLLLAVTISLLL